MVFVLAMNARRFQSLPEALRRLIRDSADPPMAESVGRAWDSVDRLNRRQARAEGHVFHQLTEAEWTRWRGAAQAVIDDWRQSTEGPALLDSARALTAEFNVLMAEEIGARTRPSRDKGG